MADTCVRHAGVKRCPRVTKAVEFATGSAKAASVALECQHPARSRRSFLVVHRSFYRPAAQVPDGTNLASYSQKGGRKKLAILARSVSGCLVSHSHTVRTRHPCRRNDA